MPDLTLIKVESPEHFLILNDQAAKNRTTVSTFKNDTSSRSHAICKIQFVNTKMTEIEMGELFIFDLAGSENTADS